MNITVLQIVEIIRLVFGMILLNEVGILSTIINKI